MVKEAAAVEHVNGDDDGEVVHFIAVLYALLEVTKANSRSIDAEEDQRLQHRLRLTLQLHHADGYSVDRCDQVNHESSHCEAREFELDQVPDLSKDDANADYQDEKSTRLASEAKELGFCVILPLL